MPLPQWVLDLRVRRENITRELANINNNEPDITSRDLPGAKPDVDGDGGGVRGTEYRTSLLTELAAINAALATAADVIAAEEAIEGSEDFADFEMIVN